jgi:hypothetical protein
MKKEVKKMVEIELLEAYHGKVYRTKKNYPSIRQAEKHVVKWNQFNNPYETLAIIGTKQKGKKKKSGWFSEQYRHKLARKGIHTGRKQKRR